VLRCAILKQYRQLSYQELAFHLEDSTSFRAFAVEAKTLSDRQCLVSCRVPTA
jgi:IS5 family transposase